MERVRDIIEGAVSRGELPTSIRNEGSAQLPWGVLDDWLYVEPFQVSLRHPPWNTCRCWPALAVMQRTGRSVQMPPPPRFSGVASNSSAMRPASSGGYQAIMA